MGRGRVVNEHDFDAKAADHLDVFAGGGTMPGRDGILWARVASISAAVTLRIFFRRAACLESVKAMRPAYQDPVLETS